MNTIINNIKWLVLIIGFFSLTACGGGGSSDPTPPANASPTLTAGADQTVASSSGTISLTATADDSDGSIVQYNWVQTSGPNVVLANTTAASASFDAPDVALDTLFTFSLTVTDDDGATASVNVFVTVQAVPNVIPVANAGADQTSTSGVIGTINLDGLNSTDSDGQIVSYSWLQTTGNTVELINTNSPIASFSIPSVSTNTQFTFELTVTDNEGATATDTVVVTIVNSPPTANAGSDRSVESGGTGILLNAGLSSDTDGTVIGYSWSQISGPTVVLTNPDNTVASFTAPMVTSDTQLVFRLLVTDNNGGATGTDEVTITVVANFPPIANAGADQAVVSGSNTPVTLNGTASTDSDGSITSYSWIQTAGDTVTLSADNTATPSFPAPTVSASGSYTFTLTVTDDKGATATDTVTVVVNNTAPIANAGIDQSVSLNVASVSLDGRASSDSDGAIASYSWSQLSGPAVSWNSNSTAVANFTLPTVSAEDQLTFRLTVTDDNGGATATDEVTITILAANLDVSVSTSDIKTVQFSWSAFPGATFYRLLVNPDGASGFTTQTDNITATTTSLTLPVHLTDWANASYQLEAHDASGLIQSSPTFSITSEMLNAIGYLVASNPTAQDQFGYAVSISTDGNTLAVGAPYEDGSGTGINPPENDNLLGSGAAYVFTLSGTTWTQQAYIKASNAGLDDSFGERVSLSSDGNILAVSAPTEGGSATGINNADDNLAIFSGAVYIFRRNGTTWVEEAYIKASNTETIDFFGEGLSLSADGLTLAVGAPSEDGGSTGINGADDNLKPASGAVYVFVYGGTPTPSWTQQAYIKPNISETGDSFGSTVSLSADGNTMAVSAVGEKSSGTGVNGVNNNDLNSAGAVYIFSRAGTSWSQQAYIKASNPGDYDAFGSDNAVSLSSDGNTLAIGVANEDGSGGINGADDNLLENSGAVYVYHRTGSNWSYQAYLKADNATQNDRFGFAISLSSNGNTLAVGAVGKSNSTGALYILTRNNGSWTQETQISSKFNSLYSQFGFSISMTDDGNTMAVGSNEGNPGVSYDNRGGVFLY